MKTLKIYLLANLLCLANFALACGPGPIFSPAGLRIFRLIDGEYSFPYHEPQNVAAWRALVGSNPSYSDIYNVVYRSSISDIQSIHSKHVVPKSLSKNQFAHLLCQRDELSEVLLTAKKCEQARENMLDPWYYPSHNDENVQQLEQVIEAAKEHMSDTLLRDRYALQMVRAQVSLRRPEENVRIWEEYASHLDTANIMRKLMVDYIIGAYHQLGMYEEEDALTIETKDYYNNPNTFLSIQSTLKKTDYDGSYWYDDYEIERTEHIFKHYRDIALKAIAHPGTKYLAQWYYTLAYIDDVLGDVKSSSQFLAKAEQTKGDEFISESIHLFRIYLDAKMQPVNDAYEARMFTNLKWITERLWRDEPKTDDLCLGCVSANYSTYYWNDMLRRIAIGIYAPRLAKSGRRTRSIQVTNYAENVWFKKVSPSYFTNEHSSYLFQCLDTCASNVTINYIAHLRNSHTPLDNFLNAGSYIDYTYLQDIAGTLCIRERNYQRAASILSNVPEDFFWSVIPGDPFAVQYRMTKDSCSTTKLQFAKKMVQLESAMKSAKSVNDRADAQIQYAIGMRNSISVCWQLSAYGVGHPWYIDSYTPNTHYKYQESTFAMANSLVNKALAMYTKDERAASAQLLFLNYRTIMEKYPGTSVAHRVRSNCENYYDFKLHNVKLPSTGDN